MCVSCICIFFLFFFLLSWFAFHFFNTSILQFPLFFFISSFFSIFNFSIFIVDFFFVSDCSVHVRESGSIGSRHHLLARFAQLATNHKRNVPKAKRRNAHRGNQGKENKKIQNSQKEFEFEFKFDGCCLMFDVGSIGKRRSKIRSVVHRNSKHQRKNG